MTNIIVRWIIVSLALFLAAQIVPGINVSGTLGWITYAVMALALGLVNAVVRPLLKLLTCPFIILTLGLFTLVINALTLLLSAQLATWLFPNLGFSIDGFWPAFFGALIVSIVTAVLSALVKDEKDEEL